MFTNKQIFKSLEYMAEKMPSNLYWLDLDGKIIGMTKKTLSAIGAKSLGEVVGKTAYDIYPKYIADDLTQHFNDVVQSRTDIKREHVIKDLSTGNLRHYTDTISPIFDDTGLELLGVVGSSFEITAEKEAEQLRQTNEQLRFANQQLAFENKTKQISAQLEEHQKFRKVADQMAHDLGSPLMALSVLENSCAELPENKRNMLRESILSIREIAGSLLSQYKPTQEEIKDSDKLESKELLVYAVLQQIIMDKQYEYQHLPVKFECEYTKNSIFSFVKSDLVLFKRMLSNLVNNAVESMNGGGSGRVTLKLDSDSHEIRVSVIDGGTGMPSSVIEKLLNNVPISLGKSHGHGIGYSQVHETLKQSNGSIEIESQECIGTTITLIFPKMSAPEWIAEEITIQNDDTVLILDDDSSIHGAWDIRFNEVLISNPNIQVKHYTQAIDVINFVDNLENKDNIVLLSDYELLRQKLNGLDVIERTKIKRSVLVTSHYTDIEIRRQAYKMDTKILPKLLASEIQINIL